MPLFSVLLIALIYLQNFITHDWLKAMGQNSQALCSVLINENAKHLHLYKAIVCAIEFKSESYNIFKETGLWHLMVVSGGHFHALIWLVGFFLFGPYRSYLRTIILTLYVLATGFQPPIIRFLLAFFFSRLGHREKLGLLKSEVLLYAGLTCILIIPEWKSSYSLALSWSAALGLILGRGQLLRSCFWTFALTSLVANFSQIGFESIFFNFVFSPVISLLLFPLCLISIPLPFLTHPLDYTMDYLIRLLEILHFYIPDIFSFSFSVDKKWVIPWVVFLNLLILISEKWQERKNLQLKKENT